MLGECNESFCKLGSFRNKTIKPRKMICNRALRLNEFEGTDQQLFQSYLFAFFWMGWW